LVFTLRERDGKSTSDRSAPAICTEGRLRTMKKKIPTFKSDDEAERFVETADLTE
jgi:hypothetical protein